MTFEKCLGLCRGIEGKSPFFSTVQCSPVVKAVGLSQSGITLSECVSICHCAGWKGDPEAVPEGCSVGSNMSLTASKCVSVPAYSHRLNLHTITHVQVHVFKHTQADATHSLWWISK